MNSCYFRFVVCFQLIVSATALSTLNAQSPIVLSEVMFNPSGNENYNEFIEIYNNSDTEVDLSGYWIGDGVDSDGIIDAGWGINLAPNQFAVILDNGYFENSTDYDSLIPPDALILTINGSTFGSRGLLNSAPETVTLFDFDSLVIAEYSYSVDNNQGFSDEKIRLSGGDDTINWSNSLVHHGTPGFKNSVSPADVDLALTRIYTLPEIPTFGESFSIFTIIENRGIRSVSGYSLTFFVDLDNDSALSAGEELLPETVYKDSLSFGDSLEFSVQINNFRWSAVTLGAIVSLDGDENSSNNSAFHAVSFSFESKVLVINEIMYDPFIEGEAFSPQSEYVELYNNSSLNIHLNGWSISDADSADKKIISARNAFVAPGGYFVIAADSNHFQFFGESENSLILGSKFPRLNNDGDEIYLYSPSETLVDNVTISPSIAGGRGIAAERIDPLSDSQSKSNWLSSVEILGGTPGKSNSVSKEIHTSNLQIKLTPNPFSPDGDGYDDLLNIDYRLPSRSVIMDIMIFDSIGRIVRRLLTSTTAGSEGIISWDGLDDRGRTLPIGIYIIYLEATSPTEGKVYSEKGVVVLARKL